MLALQLAEARALERRSLGPPRIVKSGAGQPSAIVTPSAELKAGGSVDLFTPSESRGDSDDTRRSLAPRGKKRKVGEEVRGASDVVDAGAENPGPSNRPSSLNGANKQPVDTGLGRTEPAKAEPTPILGTPHQGNHHEVYIPPLANPVEEVEYASSGSDRDDEGPGILFDQRGGGKGGPSMIVDRLSVDTERPGIGALTGKRVDTGVRANAKAGPSTGKGGHGGNVPHSMDLGTGSGNFNLSGLFDGMDDARLTRILEGGGESTVLDGTDLRNLFTESDLRDLLGGKIPKALKSFVGSDFKALGKPGTMGRSPDWDVALTGEALGQTDPETDWAYLAEGGANIVYTYGGKGNKGPFEGKIIRIRKPLVDKAIDPEFHRAEAYFHDQMLPKLVSPAYLAEHKKLSVAQGWLDRLEAAHEGKRPKARRGVDKGAVKGTGGTGKVEVMVMENLLGGPGCIAFEIKPKTGYLPSAASLPDGSPNKEVKTTHCRFCLHRRMRIVQLATGTHGQAGVQLVSASTRMAVAGDTELPNPLHVSTKPACRSNPLTAGFAEVDHWRDWNYCPLDLYSGEPRRVDKAVNELVKGWRASRGNGNNFRVFRDGKAILPVHEGNETAGATGKQHQRFAHRTFDNWIYPCITQLAGDLSRSTVFKDLVRLQQGLLQDQDIESLWHDLKTWSQGVADTSPNALDRILCDPSEAELKAFIRFVGEGSGAGSDGMEAEATTLRSRVIAFGISAVFKDCSIVIRYPNNIVTGSGGEDVVDDIRISGPPEIKLVDLDLKPLAKFRKWVSLDEEIVNAYRSSRSAKGPINPDESADHCIPATTPKPSTKRLDSDSDPIAHLLAMSRIPADARKYFRTPDHLMNQPRMQLDPVGPWGFERSLLQKKPFGALMKRNFWLVQEHQATAYHFDLRLQIDGGTFSFAIPKGFVGLGKEQQYHLAVQTPIHPISYSIHEGSDGRKHKSGVRCGTLLWDMGEYQVGADQDAEHSSDEGSDAEDDPIGVNQENKLRHALYEKRSKTAKRGDHRRSLKLTLRYGQKLTNHSFTLKETGDKYNGSGKAIQQWLLRLGRGAPAHGYEYSSDHGKSIKTGRTIQEVASADMARWIPRPEEQASGDAGGHDAGLDAAIAGARDDEDKRAAQGG